LRIRFFTSNPQDLEIEVLHVIAKHPNICRYLHLPVQSGSSSVLKRMNRQHTREEYMELTDQIKKIIPGTAISQDMIVGFCGETDEEHRDTLSMMEYVGYDYGFMYAYSERPGTLAAKRMEDDVPQSIKKQRLNEIINLQRKLSSNNTKTYLKKTIEVLIEGTSKKSQEHWMGRNSQNYVTIFPKNGEKIGDYVLVKVEECTSATLIGTKIGTAQDVPFVTNTTEKTAS
jgi:tRNA-2-methylthio-N6-dimethylallyladenosine synthase